MTIIQRQVQEFWNSFLQIVHVSTITTKINPYVKYLGRTLVNSFLNFISHWYAQDSQHTPVE